MTLDMWDPNGWPAQHECWLWMDEKLTRYALLDLEDYVWAVQWRWNIKSCRSLKDYARRAVSTYHPREDGETKLRRKGARSIYLHVEIMKRTGITPPGPNYSLVDHRNGNSLDCRRKNLRWATPSMNNKNLFGQYAHDFEDLMHAQSAA